MFISDNIGINERNHLTFADVDTIDLANKYGTPLYLIDENRIRERCRIYVDAMRDYFGEGSYPLFAGKALSFKGIYNIVESEGMGADVVSSGELYTAMRAGFNPQKICFHGNNKTDFDIAYAMDCKVGLFVCDCVEELDAINKEALKRGICQDILLRLSPGVDPHTHAKITTGLTDSKFGISMLGGAAERAAVYAASLHGISIKGFHSHIGSQIDSCDPFCEEVKRLLEFVELLKKKHGISIEIINIGGGMGIKYKEEDKAVAYRKNIKELARVCRSFIDESDLGSIKFLIEPGRSIVGDAGMTLYTIGSHREIPGCTPYTSVDGGMADNPRYALYESPYTVYSCNKPNEKYDTVTNLVGRCCESGDIIQKNISLPSPQRGDIVAVSCTGAYNYSMASNYNRLCRPALVIIKNGKPRIGVKRESFEDLVKNDV